VVQCGVVRCGAVGCGAVTNSSQQTGTLGPHMQQHSVNPPHSQKIAPCDYFLSPYNKNTLKGKQFEDVEMIELNLMQ
jgi:hypothetical protein